MSEDLLNLYGGSLEKWERIQLGFKEFDFSKSDDKEIEDLFSDLSDFIWSRCSFCRNAVLSNDDIPSDDCSNCKINHDICDKFGRGGFVGAIELVYDFKTDVKGNEQNIANLDKSINQVVQSLEIEIKKLRG